MKRVLAIAAIFGLVALAPAHAFAGVVGNVDNKIKVGKINQSNKGLLNKNEAMIGTVSNKTFGGVGNVKQDIKVGKINQSNKGLLNKNDVEIGGVK